MASDCCHGRRTGTPVERSMLTACAFGNGWARCHPCSRWTERRSRRRRSRCSSGAAGVRRRRRTRSRKGPESASASDCDLPHRPRRSLRDRKSRAPDRAMHPHSRRPAARRTRRPGASRTRRCPLCVRSVWIANTRTGHQRFVATDARPREASRAFSAARWRMDAGRSADCSCVGRDGFACARYCTANTKAAPLSRRALLVGSPPMPVEPPSSPGAPDTNQGPHPASAAPKRSPGSGWLAFT